MAGRWAEGIEGLDAGGVRPALWPEAQLNIPAGDLPALCGEREQCALSRAHRVGSKELGVKRKWTRHRVKVPSDGCDNLIVLVRIKRVAENDICGNRPKVAAFKVHKTAREERFSETVERRTLVIECRGLSVRRA